MKELIEKLEKEFFSSNKFEKRMIEVSDRDLLTIIQSLKGYDSICNSFNETIQETFRLVKMKR